MINGQVNEMTVPSAILEQEVPILVYMPDTYMPMQTYQLLIASDGADYFRYGRLGKVVQQLMDAEEIEDTIVVGIPYEDKYIRREYYHPYGEHQEKYVRFVGEELIPFLEEHFSLEDDRDARALIGDSLAATVSLTILQRYPELFSKAGLHSPLVNEIVMDIAESLDSSLETTIYHVIGKKETEVQTTSDGIKDFLQPNRELNKVLEKTATYYFYDEFEGNHTWKYWQQDMERAICKLFQMSL